MEKVSRASLPQAANDPRPPTPSLHNDPSTSDFISQAHFLLFAVRPAQHRVNND